MNKKWMAGMLCVAGTVILAACGNSVNIGALKPGEAAVETGLQDREGQADDEVVTLTIWAEPANNEVLTQMIESFKKAHAGEVQFDIQLVEAADAETRQRLLSDIHSGADIFAIPDDQLTGLVAGGALAKVPNADEVREADLDEAVAASSVNGVLYAYPMTSDNGYFLYYDKDYFTEGDVQTLDRILEVCAENGKKFTMEWSSGWYLYSFFGNTGMEFGVNEDGVTNYCNWNTTEGAITGVDVAEAMLAIAANPGFENLTDGEFLTGVQNGRVIAGVSGAWNAAEIEAVWGSDYGAAKLPTYTVAGQQVQMSSFVGYKMLGVNAYSEHVDWALKLADWITNEENQTLRFVERSQAPANRNAAASEAVGQVPAIAAVIEQGQYGVLQRVGNNYWEATADFGQNMAAGNPGGTDLQEVMDTLVSGITASTIQ